jgi:hypothetical protein
MTPAAGPDVLVAGVVGPPLADALELALELADARELVGGEVLRVGALRGPPAPAPAEVLGPAGPLGLIDGGLFGLVDVCAGPGVGAVSGPSSPPRVLTKKATTPISSRTNAVTAATAATRVALDGGLTCDLDGPVIDSSLCRHF